jgi:hypothetical protein
MPTRQHHKPKSDKKEGRRIKPQQLILRCYAEQKGHVWQAFCLDLNLAVQGNSRAEVKGKLHSQISEYLHDALVGEDRAYANQLLKRRAPLGFWVKYYCYKTAYHFQLAHNGIREFFDEVMPLTVAHHA